MLPHRPLKYHLLWVSIGWFLIVAVITLSLIPDPPTPEVNVPGIDKIGHFIAYFALMTWFCLTYLRNAHLWIGVRLIFLGVTLEVLQWILGQRFFEAADILGNILGIAAGWLLTATRFSRLLQWTEQTVFNNP